MQLAKQALDVGLYTNQLDPMLAFWQQQPGVEFDELLKLGGGVHQHRHRIGESILKINHPREPVNPGVPTGLACIELSTRSSTDHTRLKDPDGNELLLCQHDANTLAQLHLHLKANDVERSATFYGETLGLPGNATEGFRVGTSRIYLTQGEVLPAERVGLGFRYMTLQVFDVVQTHADILARGGEQGMAPVKLGDVAYISFVRDVDGNYIEISQRKSITGSLE